VAVLFFEKELENYRVFLYFTILFCHILMFQYQKIEYYNTIRN